MAKMGPKFKEINWEQVIALCAIQCTKPEICAVINVSEDTLERAIKRKFKLSYADFYAEKRAGGRASLRRKQYESAINGNTALLIWLGKQYLGQSDKLDQNLNQSGSPVKIEISLPDNSFIEKK